MSDGKTHASFTTGSALGIISGTMLTTFMDTKQIFIASGGCMLGLLLSPDLDVDNGHIGSYYARKLHIGFVFDIFWQPYRESLKHRSFWSHFPIISTLVRMLYLFFPITIFLFKDQDTRNGRILFLLLPSMLLSALPIVGILLLYTLKIDIIYYSLPILAGLIISDIGHWLKDV